jgi:protein-S-isoprenylcysteine O-methyltransferase Ste14
VSPPLVSIVLLDVWALSWGVAALWSRRTQARPPLGERFTYFIPTVIGAGLFFSGAARYAGEQFGRIGEPPSWALAPWAGWAATLVVVAGLAFAWWARLTLGDLWSGTVTRKEGHVIVETGPYRLVRHPIYTGLIVALFAIAIQLGAVTSLLGVAVITFSFWMKARLEERFLSGELGPAYADYRRRTPMLAPFWPTGR